MAEIDEHVPRVEHVFVYGTLRRDYLRLSHSARTLRPPNVPHEYGEWLGTRWLYGHALVDTGEYPGLVPASSATRNDDDDDHNDGDGGDSQDEIENVDEARTPSSHAADDNAHDDCAPRVLGDVVRLTDARAMLPVLDEYEGASPMDEQPHEYRREVRRIDGIWCYVYVYNWWHERALQLPVIPDGDYVAYVARKRGASLPHQ